MWLWWQLTPGSGALCRRAGAGRGVAEVAGGGSSGGQSRSRWSSCDVRLLMSPHTIVRTVYFVSWYLRNSGLTLQDRARHAAWLSIMTSLWCVVTSVMMCHWPLTREHSEALVWSPQTDWDKETRAGPGSGSDSGSGRDSDYHQILPYTTVSSFTFTAQKQKSFWDRRPYLRDTWMDL